MRMFVNINVFFSVSMEIVCNFTEDISALYHHWQFNW